MEITENLTVQEEDKEEILTMPCIPLRGLLVYPRTVLHFDVGREKSIRALEAAMNKDKILFVSSQKDENILIPTPDDYYKVGTVVKIKQMLKIQGDSVRVLVEGMYRASIKEITAEEPYISASVDRLKSINMPEDSIEARAMTRVVLNSFNEYAQLATGVRTDIYDLSVIIDDPDALADSIAIQLDIDISKKQKILETLDVRERLTILNGIIFEENQILRLERSEEHTSELQSRI